MTAVLTRELPAADNSRSRGKLSTVDNPPSRGELLATNNSPTSPRVLDRPTRKRIRVLLTDLVWMITDLEEGVLTVTVGSGSRRPVPSSRPPCGDEELECFRLLGELRRELRHWTAAVCEHAHLAPPSSSLVELATWLTAHLDTLARCPHAELVAPRLEGLHAEAFRLIDPADDPAPTIPNTIRMEQANRQVVTALNVERLAAKLGPEFAALDRTRVRTLERARAIHPVGRGTDTGTKFYSLGSVLVAHRQHAARERRLVSTS